MITKRMEREEYFMRIALVVKERSTCGKAKVGAVLVDPMTNRIVATGYNGSPKKAPHCIAVGCLEVDLGNGHGKSCIRTIHAELNAILHLEHNYPVLHLYCTHQPCVHCLKALIGANVVKIYYLHDYKDLARDLLARELDIHFTPMYLRVGK